MRGSEGEEDIVAERYIEQLKSFMINVRIKYGFREGQDLLTAMIYPSKKIIKSVANLKIQNDKIIIYFPIADDVVKSIKNFPQLVEDDKKIIDYTFICKVIKCVVDGVLKLRFLARK